MYRAYLRVVTQFVWGVRAQTGGQVVSRIVLIRAYPCGRHPTIRPPFILCGTSNGARVLLRITIVSHRRVI